MLRSESFWNDLRIFAQQHSQYGLLLILALIIVASLWRWRPQDRKPVTATLLFFMVALCGLALSGVLAALDIKAPWRGFGCSACFCSV